MGYTLSHTGVPEPPTAVFPDCVMLDRIGRTICHDDRAAACEAVKNDTTALKFSTARRLSGYISFTLAAPPKVSYLDLHWKLPLPAYPFVLSVDGNLLLLSIAIAPISPSKYASDDLFIYEAGPSPSVLQLPSRTRSARGIGILGLADGHYLMADLISTSRKGNDDDDGGSDPVIAKFPVYSSKTRNRQVVKKTVPQPQGLSNRQFPILCTPDDDVLPFDGRFLCVLLCNFSSEISDPGLHFVPYPGKQYADEVQVSKCFSDRFRSVSLSRGMMRFVHIDNDWHQSVCMDDKDEWYESGSMDDDDDDWHGSIDRSEEFPIFSPDDPDSLCYLLREAEFAGNAWMIIVDMKHEMLRSCTRYVNENLSYIPDIYLEERKRSFSDVPLLPAVFSKYLSKPSGIQLRATHKFTARRSSKKTKISI
ncbi:hypothetical protein BRADI_1g26270v3 [Brachypodium distachyon]|uniref:DUF1618 domain-containing protein n=1 Tax=Brachypodium distachyon TaxID=15368 RepID=I1GTZ3_BRADI|nr:hypothetical protein BRADI_1g26270v3 [Brachypodium distachyon]